MAHFAELDDNNKVLRVVIVGNGDILNENGEEVEQLGIDLCKSQYGENTRWVQTSYNNNFRGTYAGTGYTYDEVNDLFIPNQPFPSWTFDYQIYMWRPPIDPPEYDKNGPNYYWDEETLSWIPNYV